ncbi:MAG TPA: twin-arginine translocase TatA/TatE family subunit [Candidatus Limnocylindrales bacterium]|nr:twin-arginine translocase TatA/TatE family subunit [Candidatus Limnocylindrales bacterium]
MLGIGHWWIIILVLAIVLIIYGPGKLPEVGGAIGKGIREFRKASTDLTEEIKRSTEVTPAPPQPGPSSEIKPADTTAPTEPKA